MTESQYQRPGRQCIRGLLLGRRLRLAEHNTNLQATGVWAGREDRQMTTSLADPAGNREPEPPSSPFPRV